MITSRRRVLSRVVGFLFLGPILSCAPSPRLYLQYEGRLHETGLEQILAENPLAPAENLRVTNLGKGIETSHHVVQIRDREAPHVHKVHDLTVVVLKGSGTLWLNQKAVDLVKGDILFLPRDTVHYFINTAREPSVALAVFSPAFDGKDSLPANAASSP
jgi:quercetin dioxygenase-like cupin family protein